MNKHGDTALHLAAENDCQEVAKLLLKNSANLLAKNNNGFCPLHLASLNGINFTYFVPNINI